MSSAKAGATAETASSGQRQRGVEIGKISHVSDEGGNFCGVGGRPVVSLSEISVGEKELHCLAVTGRDDDAAGSLKCGCKSVTSVPLTQFATRPIGRIVAS